MVLVLEPVSRWREREREKKEVGFGVPVCKHFFCPGTGITGGGEEGSRFEPQKHPHGL